MLSPRDAELAKAWVEFTSRLHPERGDLDDSEYNSLSADEDWAVSDLLMISLSDPGRAYEIVLEMLSMTSDDWVIASIAAGPVETILRSHAAEFVPRLSRDVHANPNIRSLPEYLWLGELPDALRRELSALIGERNS